MDGDDMTSLVAVEAAEVLAAGERTLAELAQVINREHQQGAELASRALEHWIRTGEALREAREKCDPGSWPAWVEDNLNLGRSAARNYMRIAHYSEYLRALPGPIQSAVGALELLAGMPATDGAGRTVMTRANVEHARALRAEGYGYKSIARVLGTDHKTVSRALDPNAGARERARKARRRKAQAALLREERDQAIKQAVRKAGAATAEAWNMAERMQDVLAQAQRETEDREARRALSEAGVHYRKMRDEIVRALGVS